MCADDFDAVLEQIDQASLTATSFRTAIKLLRLAAANKGSILLSRPEAVALCGTDSDATMRTHLYQLARAGIITYTAKSKVYVQFDLWILRAQRAKEKELSDNLRAQRANDNNDTAETLRAQRANSQPTQQDFALSAQIYALSAQIEPEGADSPHTGASAPDLGWLVDPVLPNTGRKKKPTNQPKNARKHAAHRQRDDSRFASEEQQLALDLLVDRDVGITFEIAEILAREAPCLDIYRLVDDWLPDYREGKVKTGALVDRIRRVVESPRGAQEPKVVLSTAFRETDVYRRHRLPDRVIADADRKTGYSQFSTYDRSQNRPEDYTDLEVT